MADAFELAVVQQPIAVAAGDNFDTAVLAEGIGQRHPHGEHVSLVGLGQNHAVVLMPGRGTDGEAGDAAVVVLGDTGQKLLGRFDADVLDGVGVDFRADEVFDDVEELFVAQHREGGGTNRDGRVRADAALGQRDVEVLGVNLAGFVVDLAEALVKAEVGVCGGNLPYGEKLVGKLVEDFVVFGQDGIDVSGGIEEVFDEDEAVFVVLVELGRG